MNKKKREAIEKLVRSKAALLVIDMQYDYCSPNGMVPRRRKLDVSPITRMLPRLGKFISLARERHIPVIWTRMIEDIEYMPPNFGTVMKSGKVVMPHICKPGTRGFGYYKLKPQKGDKEFIKTHYNAFTNKKLHEYLKKKGIKTLIFTGVYASRCVDSTARSASEKGYNCIILRDLVEIAKEYQYEKRGSLSVIGTLFGFVVSSRGLTDILQEI